MKAGRLFERALKQADINLTAGTELTVQVKSRGNHLHLIVSPPVMSKFEETILERSKKAGLVHEIYQPHLPVGEMIRALRKASGQTLESLSKKAKLSKGSLGSIEKGDRPVGLAVLKKLAQALGIPLAMLTG